MQFYQISSDHQTHHQTHLIKFLEFKQCCIFIWKKKNDFFFWRSTSIDPNDSMKNTKDFYPNTKRFNL